MSHAGQAVSYLVATLPIALLAIPAVLLLLVGAALSVIGIGLPLVVVAAVVCRRLVRLDRRAANHFLDAHVPPIPSSGPPTGPIWRPGTHVLAHRTPGRVVAPPPLQPPPV